MAVSRPESKQIIWDEKPRTFKDLVTGSRLPCLIKIVSGDIASHLPPDKVDGWELPILSVLELKKHKMLITRKMQYDRRNGEYTPTEQILEIPVTHKGWFEAIPNDGRVVEYFDSISAITSVRPKQFLVRSSLVGYQLNTDNGISNWIPHEVEPGEVLRTGVVHMDQKKNRRKPFLKRMFSSGKSGRRDQELKYLQCFDRKGREIMIPLIIAGVFSPIGDDVSRANYDAVYALHDLVMTFNLPLKAKLVFSDNIGKDRIPPGVVLFESVVDHENVLVAKHPYVKNESETFEIPANAKILVVKEKRRKSSKNTDLEVQKNSVVDNNVLATGVNEIAISDAPVNLPIRVKDSKRSKGSSIFDKLTVRSKAKKERASLKALQEIGVFSSRLSKSEINFENLYTNEVEEDVPEKDTEDVENTDTQDTPIHQRDTSQSEQDQRRLSIQGRDLPPIPVNTGNQWLGLGERDGLYEELPSRAVMDIVSPNEQEDSDGYIEPAQVRNPNGHKTINGTRKIGKTKPPTAPRPRRMKGNMEKNVALCDMEDLTIRKSFDCEANSANGRSENSQANRQINRQVYAFEHVPFNDGADITKGKPGSYMYDDAIRLHDDSETGQKELLRFAKLKSRTARNIDIDVNATIRSHNIRRKRAVMDVFPNGDPVKDFRQSMTFSMDDHDHVSAEPGYGRIVENERLKSYLFGNQSLRDEQNISLSESEPDFAKRYHHSLSQTAMSDTYLKYGNDSAISLCSRGEYEMTGGSEYSYSEYSDRLDDNWVPPANIKNLSVMEVSKSLRYIGMKDRIVIRFANEQIDGNMLCSLDEKLLREGFTELNALERKKILDFILGWRPKK